MKAFASQADLKPKKITFQRLSKNAYAFTAEGDPNTGIVVGDDGVMVIDTQATPLMAREVIRRVRRVTSKPIRYVVLTHYHAVRVLGAAAYKAEQIIASRGTLGLIRERGRQDMASEIGRFPRLFRGAESIPGLTWPTLVFDRELTVMMGNLEVRILHLGPGHTGGDAVVWLPSQRVLFSGDLVEYNAGIYTGDAHLEEWPATLGRLSALRPWALVPGRGPALTTPAECRKAIRFTRDFVRGLYASARRGVLARRSLKEVYAATKKKMDPVYGRFPIYEHCMPFDVSRAYDEARGLKHPRIWTAKRDVEMWKSIA
ncbi:MAG: MBL fold metallo-hydrolase [Betaproteobacteria bacterium]|nr:MBL fold metallo-hydrolase [Betaproteobacteria bacterium]MDH5223134.1 MBL fold metallo-hydrolase [Betaproteobacteria bacterium]MDH5352716.1 MBL fold metallo-hydrolase [Betaproteobacteria bacterium]